MFGTGQVSETSLVPIPLKSESNKIYSKRLKTNESWHQSWNFSVKKHLDDKICYKKDPFNGSAHLMKLTKFS